MREKHVTLSAQKLKMRYLALSSALAVYTDLEVLYDLTALDFSAL